MISVIKETIDGEVIFRVNFYESKPEKLVVRIKPGDEENQVIRVFCVFKTSSGRLSCIGIKDQEEIKRVLPISLDLIISQSTELQCALARLMGLEVKDSQAEELAIRECLSFLYEGRNLAAEFSRN